IAEPRGTWCAREPGTTLHVRRCVGCCLPSCSLSASPCQRTVRLRSQLCMARAVCPPRLSRMTACAAELRVCAACQRAWRGGAPVHAQPALPCLCNAALGVHAVVTCTDLCPGARQHASAVRVSDRILAFVDRAAARAMGVAASVRWGLLMAASR